MENFWVIIRCGMLYWHLEVLGKRSNYSPRKFAPFGTLALNNQSASTKAASDCWSCPSNSQKRVRSNYRKLTPPWPLLISKLAWILQVSRVLPKLGANNEQRTENEANGSSRVKGMCFVLCMGRWHPSGVFCHPIRKPRAAAQLAVLLSLLMWQTEGCSSFRRLHEILLRPTIQRSDKSQESIHLDVTQSVNSNSWEGIMGKWCNLSKVIWH